MPKFYKFCIFLHKSEIYYSMYKIFDLHNDYFLKIHSNNKKDKYVQKGGVKNIVSAIWTSELSCEESMREIEKARDYVNNKQELFLGVEDLHFLNKNNLELFLKTKPIYAGLTWNTTNCIAGGVSESGGITSFGKNVIKVLEDFNIQIDTAHLNEESFSGVAKLTKKPLFCSHTAFFGLQPHVRNLKDYQLKMIVDSGGLVGLCLVSPFLCGNERANIKDFTSHIDYFACKFGVENLAIGTDFFGTKHLPKNVTNYTQFLHNISVALERLGYTQKAINKIFYENANNFFV